MKAYLSGDQTYTIRIGDQTEYKLHQATNDYLANFSTNVESGKCVLNISMLNSVDVIVKVVS